MSRLIELVVEGSSLKAIKADLWDNRGVDGYIDIQDEVGCTPLMWSKTIEIFSLLLTAGADVQIKSNMGHNVSGMLKWRKEHSLKSIKSFNEIAKMEELLKAHKKNHPEIFGWHYEKSTFEGVI